MEFLLERAPVFKQNSNELAMSQFIQAFLGALFMSHALSQDEFCVIPNSTLPTAPIIIKNPVIDDFGTWGDWDECTKGTFLAGIQLRFEEPYRDLAVRLPKGQLVYLYSDNAVLTGIRGFCSKVGENKFAEHQPTSAVVMSGGDWLAPMYCDVGVINGFQLRHTAYVNGTKIDIKNRIDNVGAVNIRIHCVKTHNRLVWLESNVDDPQEVYTWSIRLKTHRLWSPKQLCGPGQAVAAIRTQVDLRERPNAKFSEEEALAQDLRGLTNIQMRCEKIPIELDTCRPMLFYQKLVECNNIKGTSPLTCTYETRVGTQSSLTNRKSEVAKRSILSSLGVTVEVTTTIFYAKMRDLILNGVNNGETNLNATSDFWRRQTVKLATVTVPPNRIQRIFQVVGTCGEMEVRTSRIISDDRIGDIPDPVPSTGFVCTEPKTLQEGEANRLKDFESRDEF